VLELELELERVRTLWQGRQTTSWRTGMAACAEHRVALNESRTTITLFTQMFFYYQLFYLCLIIYLI
jgi:hypothetical protein